MKFSSKTIVTGGVLLCVLGGSLLSIQAGVNGLLSKSIGTPIGAAFFSFLVGTIALAIGPFWIGDKPDLCYVRNDGAKLPGAKYFLIPGFLGAIFVTGNTYLAPILGSLQFVGMVTGQLSLSLYLDHIGYLGIQTHRLSKPRALGALLTLAGAVMAAVERISDFGGSEGESRELIPLYLVLSVLNGMPLALQPLYNAVFTKTLGTVAQRTATWSFFVGAVILAIIWSVLILALDEVPDFSEVDWTYFLGGPMGSFYVTISTFMIPHIGSSLLVTSVVGGQLFASLLLDQFGALGFPLVPMSALRVAGVGVAFTGVVVMKFGERVSCARGDPKESNLETKQETGDSQV